MCHCFSVVGYVLVRQVWDMSYWMVVFGGGGCLSVWVYRDLDEVCALCVATEEEGRDGVEGEEGGLTCLRGQETYSLLSVQQGERVVQLIIQAKARHSAWVALPWWADRRKLKDAIWKKKKKKKWRKWERWMSLVMECNPMPAFISFSPLHLKRGLPLSW